MVRILLLIIFLGSGLVAQEPFNVPVTSAKLDSSTARKGFALFGQQALTKSLGNGAQRGMVFESKVIQYRLGIYTNSSLLVPCGGEPETFMGLRYSSRCQDYDIDARMDSSKNVNGSLNSLTVKKRYYVPLLLISKISTDYQSNNVASIDDFVSLSGGPITLRAMPTLRFGVGAENSLSIGAIADVRALLVKDTAGSQITQTSFYGALGAQYAGPGEVEEESQVYQGNWSLSGVLSVSSGQPHLKKLLYQKNVFAVWAIEGVFKFNVVDDGPTKLNLMASARHTLQDPTGEKWVVSFAMGN